MAKDFVKLSEVAVKEEVSDNATVLVEENGEIYRAPKTSVGGGAGGIKTAIIRQAHYLDVIAGVMPGKTVDPDYECINMTFEEAYNVLSKGEPLMIVGMLLVDGQFPVCAFGNATFDNYNIDKAIHLAFWINESKVQYIEWRSDYFGSDK